VVIDGKILGKPKNKSQAREMLSLLSGREHKVLTGYSIIRAAHRIRKIKVVQSSVRFKEIAPEEIAWYLASSEPYDKAGGYAAQGMGAGLIKAIRGSYTNVIGLPLCEVLEDLHYLGAINFR